MRPDVEPVLVGAVRGVEARLLPTRDFRFHLLPSEPIYRRTWWRNVRWPLVAGRLLREVGRAVRRGAARRGARAPAATPPARSSGGRTRHGIPTAIQEQNAYPGLATRLAEPPGAPRLPRPARGAGAAPLRPPRPGLRHRQPDRPADARATARAALARFGLDGTRPVVLVTGGSQGALAINRAVAGWLDAGGPADADLLWVTGRGTHDGVRRPATGRPTSRSSIFSTRWPTAMRWPISSSRGRA